MRHQFIVELEMPKGVGINQMKSFILREIKSSTGMRDPNDPLFRLDRSKVRVSSVSDTVRRDAKFIRKVMRNREIVEGLFRQVDCD